MITPDEIKKALEICAGDKCEKCPYHNRDTWTSCLRKMPADALDYIQQLEAQISELTENGKCGGCV